MLKIVSFLLVGLAVGFAIASWSGRGAPGDGSTSADTVTARRLEALEEALAAERRERVALEDQVFALEQNFAAQESVELEYAERLAESVPEAASDDDRARIESLTEPFPEPVRERLNVALRARGSVEDRVSLFVEGGFSPERAQWIVERTEALRMEALQARYDAAREGEPVPPRSALSAEQALRSELGDDGFERYLHALGRPSTVSVGDVLGNSPAAQAGLLSGDEIVAYSGERVFGMSDLNRLTYAGEPGETVAIDIVRDGQPMQIYVPRGPIGITGSGRFRVRGR